jgi:hypothetical protein
MKRVRNGSVLDIVMSMSPRYQIVICAGIVSDSLQALELVASLAAPALKNEMLLPDVLDPWAGHALHIVHAAIPLRDC